MRLRFKLLLATWGVLFALNVCQAEFGDELFTLVPRFSDNSLRQPEDGAEFGGETAIFGDFGLVSAEEDFFFGTSAGAVWLYDVTTGTPIATLDPEGLEDDDGLGESVDLQGTTAVISADGKNMNTGAAYIFDISTQTQVRTLTASDGMSGDEFGQAVGISGDLIVVGAENADEGQGAAYVFRASTGEELLRLSVNDPEEAEIGNEVAITGNHILLGGDNPAVYLFDATTGQMRKKLTGEQGSSFGTSMAMDGNWGLVGADEEEDDAGAAYLIDLEAAEIVRRLQARDKEENDDFGDTVAIEGTTVLIAATGDNDDAGSVYVFDAITGMQLAKLAPEGIAMDDGFGSSISVYNGTALIGADEDLADNGQGSGLAYVFNVSLVELADVNDDGSVDVADIDDLSQAVASGSTDLEFDLNHDEVVDQVDRVAWVEALQHTYFGDSNLDGIFDSSDLVAVFGVGEYEDEVEGNSGWADGDWNGDGDFDSGDLVAAFSAGGYNAGTRTAVASVPEPSCLSLLALGLVTAGVRFR